MIALTMPVFATLFRVKNNETIEQSNHLTAPSYLTFTSFSNTSSVSLICSFTLL